MRGSEGICGKLQWLFCAQQFPHTLELLFHLVYMFAVEFLNLLEGLDYVSSF